MDKYDVMLYLNGIFFMFVLVFFIIEKLCWIFYRSMLFYMEVVWNGNFWEKINLWFI